MRVGAHPTGCRRMDMRPRLASLLLLALSLVTATPSVRRATQCVRHIGVSNRDATGGVHHNVYKAAFFSVEFNESMIISGAASLGDKEAGELLLGTAKLECGRQVFDSRPTGDNAPFTWSLKHYLVPLPQPSDDIVRMFTQGIPPESGFTPTETNYVAMLVLEYREHGQRFKILDEHNLESCHLNFVPVEEQTHTEAWLSAEKSRSRYSNNQFTGRVSFEAVTAPDFHSHPENALMLNSACKLTEVKFPALVNHSELSPGVFLEETAADENYAATGVSHTTRDLVLLYTNLISNTKLLMETGDFQAYAMAVEPTIGALPAVLGSSAGEARSKSVAKSTVEKIAGKNLKSPDEMKVDPMKGQKLPSEYAKQGPTDGAFIQTNSMEAGLLQLKKDEPVDQVGSGDMVEPWVTTVAEGVSAGVVARISSGTVLATTTELSATLQAGFHDFFAVDKIVRSITRSAARSLIWSVSEALVGQVAMHCIEGLGRQMLNQLTTTVTESVSGSLSQMLIPSIQHSLQRSPKSDMYCYYCSHFNTYCQMCQEADNHDYYSDYYSHYYGAYYTKYYTHYYAKFFPKNVHQNAKENGCDGGFCDEIKWKVAEEGKEPDIETPEAIPWWFQ